MEKDEKQQRKPVIIAESFRDILTYAGIRGTSDAKELAKVLIENSDRENCRVDYVGTRAGVELTVCQNKACLAPWARKNRTVMRPGRVIRAIWETWEDEKKDETSEYQLKALAEFIQNELAIFPDVRIVTGQDIARYYHEDAYDVDWDDESTLANSCMRYDECQEYFGLYTQNPNHVGMIICSRDGDYIQGRALVWSQSGNGKWTHIDRIYSGDGNAYRQIVAAARSMGLVDMREQYESGDASALTIQLDYWVFQSYPYMDTMLYLDVINGRLQNYHATRNDSGHRAELQSTDGEGPDFSWYCAASHENFDYFELPWGNDNPISEPVILDGRHYHSSMIIQTESGYNVPINKAVFYEGVVYSYDECTSVQGVLIPHTRLDEKSQMVRSIETKILFRLPNEMAEVLLNTDQWETIKD